MSVCLDLDYCNMKRIKLSYIIIFCLTAINSFPNSDSLFSQPKFVKHLSFSDTFFGSEDMYQVCYPKDHRSFFYSIIIFSIATLVLGILVIYIKTNSNKKLKEKNLIIEEQNKDLLDSINYALRIQQVILPEEKNKKNILKNGFVFYQPKHIVSGDFYWLHQNGNLSFIALIDCTGHGVPGALLTMLAYNAINKTICENCIIDPKEILDHMNSEIKYALKQNKNNSIQDSMEVGIVCVDNLSKTIKFAGAGINLQLIQNDRSSIVKGAKCAVGSHQPAVTDLPHTHHFSLNTGDSFYLYSDGFADQFGGPKGKKFKYKQLEELLHANNHLPNHQQLENLEERFNSWKGKLEQVDDVTVIGYKF